MTEPKPLMVPTAKDPVPPESTPAISPPPPPQPPARSRMAEAKLAKRLLVPATSLLDVPPPGFCCCPGLLPVRGARAAVPRRHACRRDRPWDLGPAPGAACRLAASAAPAAARMPVCLGGVAAADRRAEAPSDEASPAASGVPGCIGSAQLKRPIRMRWSCVLPVARSTSISVSSAGHRRRPQRLPLAGDGFAEGADRFGRQFVGEDRLLEMLAAVAQHVGDGRIEVVADVGAEEAEHRAPVAARHERFDDQFHRVLLLRHGGRGRAGTVRRAGCADARRG